MSSVTLSLSLTPSPWPDNSASSRLFHPSLKSEKPSRTIVRRFSSAYQRRSEAARSSAGNETREEKAIETILSASPLPLPWLPPSRPLFPFSMGLLTSCVHPNCSRSRKMAAALSGPRAAWPRSCPALTTLLSKASTRPASGTTWKTWEGHDRAVERGRWTGGEKGRERWVVGELEVGERERC